MVELDFFIFLPYSFRLIGPQTKQGYIHPWSVKIGLNTKRDTLRLSMLQDVLTNYVQDYRAGMLAHIIFYGDFSLQFSLRTS